MTVLLTGYEPFGEHETNPSERLATRFDGRTVDGREVVGRVLPVEFDRRALYTARHHTDVPSGFVHLPQTPSKRRETEEKERQRVADRSHPV